LFILINFVAFYPSEQIRFEVVNYAVGCKEIKQTI